MSRRRVKGRGDGLANAVSDAAARRDADGNGGVICIDNKKDAYSNTERERVTLSRLGILLLYKLVTVPARRTERLSPH